MPTQQRTPSADAYSTHQKYWADSGGDIALPVDPYAVAESMGIRVFSAILGPGKSGYLDIAAKGGPVIYVNEAHSAVRNRFTCAHEIGHFVDAENQGFAGGLDTFDRDERAASGFDPTEIYANRFAAALLMPKDAVSRLHRQGMSTSELANRFRVSLQSMDLRLKNLNLTANS